MSEPLRILVVGPKHSSANSRGGMASVVTLMREHVDPRVRIRTVATYVDDTRVRRLAVGVWGVLVSVLLVAGHRVDVVHVHLSHRGSVTRKAIVLWAARLARVPAIAHAHSFDFGGWFDDLTPARKRLVRAALPARRWLVLGDALAAEYALRLQLPDELVRVLRNPVLPLAADTGVDRAGKHGYRGDGSVLHPAADTDEEVVRVVFLGRHGVRKGSFDLVAAVARLVALDPSIRGRLRVVAAGDGEVARVRAAIVSAGVADVLTVRGWAPAAERDALLHQGDVLVLPSYEEGLPMAVLEAMGAGLAVIVTPVGAIGEVVTDGVDALVVAPGDIAGLATALGRLVSDAELRRRLSVGARVRASELGFEPWFDALVAHWRAITS